MHVEETSSEPERGVLTLAFGSDRYVRMATNLALSIKRNWPDTPIAIVTDRVRADVDFAFDYVIPLDITVGRTLEQKLNLHRYSPFKETLYIDSDCLVVRDMSAVWLTFSGRDFATIGSMKAEGRWFGGDLAEVCANFGLPGGIAKFNGGLMYWRRGSKSAAVFETAQSLVPKYSGLGFESFRAGLALADEPLIGLAMALHGQEAVDDGGQLMWTPVDICGRMQIDVLHQICRFNKAGRTVTPACPHFCGPHAKFGYYRREQRKLRVAGNSGAGANLVSPVLNAIYSPLTVMDHGGVWRLVRKILSATRKRWN